MGCCFSHSFLEARKILGINSTSYEVVDDTTYSAHPPIVTTSEQINNNSNENSYQPPKRPKLIHSTSLRKISHAVPVPVALPNTARVTRSESVPAFLTNLNKENQVPLLQQVQAKYAIENPIENLPIAIDLPRLINNTEVKDEHGVLFEKPANDATPRGREQLIKSFLQVIMTKTRISDVDNVLTRYDAIVLQRIESDLPPRLKEFFLTLGDDSPVINLLKVVNQALIATAVTKIKMYFMGHFVLKDVRNGWDVVLSFGDTHAVVSHIKWEETMPAAFKLCWQLDYVFDKQTWDLKDASLRIVKLEFTVLTDRDEQDAVQELVDGFSA
jgi:hypothetical protein